MVLVGADRIAANGDTANKVGTYPLAVLAAAPRRAVLRLRPADVGRPRDARRCGHPDRGRPADEVTKFRGLASRRPGTDVRNPSFDVTPAELITGIVTDEGVLRPPFGPALAEALERNKVRRAAAVPSAVPSADPVADSA